MYGSTNLQVWIIVDIGFLVACHQIGAASGAFMGDFLYDFFARYQSVWLASITPGGGGRNDRAHHQGPA